MPSTRVETAMGWLGDSRAAFLAAIQQALVEGILIPDQDRDIRLTEYHPQNLLKSDAQSARHTNIEITLFTGRSLDAKRRLYQALVQRLAPFGLEPGDIKVVLIEVPRDNWGLRGLPASEIDLGFKVDV